MKINSILAGSHARATALILACLAILVAAPAPAQVLDGRFVVSPFEAYTEPQVPDGTRTPVTLTGSTRLNVELCEQGKMCVADALSSQTAPELAHQVALGDSTAAARVNAAGQGMEAMLHLSPLIPYRSFADASMGIRQTVRVPPHTTLVVTTSLHALFDPALPAGIPYEGTAFFMLELAHPEYGGDIETLDWTTGGRRPATLDETFHVRHTNYTDELQFVMVASDLRGTMTLVPEPAGWVLLATGLAAFALARRARRLASNGTARYSRVAMLLFPVMASLPLAARAQLFDGTARFNPTTVLHGTQVQGVADWRTVALSGELCDADGCTGTRRYRDTVPETFSQGISMGDSWAEARYDGDSRSSELRFHSDLDGAARGIIRQGVDASMQLVVPPHATAFLQMPLWIDYSPNAQFREYELFYDWALVARNTVTGLFTTDRVRLAMHSGGGGTIDDSLGILLANPDTDPIVYEVRMWGNMNLLVTAVPEPGPFTLLGTGLLLLACLCRARSSGAQSNAAGVPMLAAGRASPAR